MTPINQDDVLLILRLLDDSAFDELRLEIGDLKLSARKRGKGKNSEEAVFGDPSPGPKDPNWAFGKMASSDSEIPMPEPTRDDSGVAPGLIPIKAPTLGTFYRTSKPGTPPYVEAGSMVNEDDPVCIIEVMKLLNTVKAGIRGRIVKICAQHGEMVEFQQTLFLVEKLESEGLPPVSQA